MAYEAGLRIIAGLVAAGDLSSDQFKFVRLTASNVALNSINGGLVDGVLQDKPEAAGRACSVASGGVTKVKAGAAFAKGAQLMSNSLGLAVTAASVATSAVKDCGVETFDLNPGDTIVIDVDNVGNATATWDAAAATIEDTTSYAVTDQDGLTSIVTLAGGTYDGIAQTVTFSGATTTALLVAAGMNAQLVGCSADGSSGQVILTHDDKGTDMGIAVTAGTGNLTWDTPVAGTGDVANINEVTALEIETVIEADTTALVTIATGIPTIASPTTGVASELDFISGLALTKLGLSVETLNGSASDTHVRGKAIQAASASGDIVTMSLEPTSKV